MVCIRGEKQHPICSIGIHLFTFVNDAVVRVDSAFSREPDGRVDKIRWDFQSDKCNKDGEPYYYQPLTGFIFGDERASLTQIIRSLVQGITASEDVNIDISTLWGRRFEGEIKHKKIDDKTKVAYHVYLKPIDEKS